MTWLYVPRSVTSAFTQAEEGLTSAYTERCETLAASATWRSKRLPSARWLRLWKRERWMRRLCGLMPEPSTADASVAMWLASLEEAPARSSPSPTPSARTPQRSDLPPTEGASSSDSSKSPRSAELSGSFGRTSEGQVLLFPSCSSGWSRRAGGEHGQAFRHLMLAHPTKGSATSCWPTATARDWRGSAHSEEMAAKGGRTLNETTWAWARSHPDLMMTLPGAMSLGHVRSWPQLCHNPFFVAWLMGWTWWLAGWDASISCAYLVTESSQSKPPLPSDSSGATASENEAA